MYTRDLGSTSAVEHRGGGTFRAPFVMSVVSRSAANEQARGGDIFHGSALTADSAIAILADFSSKGAVARRDVEMLLEGFFVEASACNHPARILSGLNASRIAADADVFACTFVARFDRSAGTVTYSSAGHDLALLLSGRKHVHLDATGPALGVIERATFHDRVLPFGDGDALLIATDGFTECHASADRSKMFGSAGIVRSVRGLDPRRDDLADAVARAADAFTGGTYRDDATVACIVHAGALFAGGEGPIRPWGRRAVAERLRTCVARFHRRAVALRENYLTTTSCRL